ncbi:hypothetical protein M8756_05395 [Lutimaribacter sp. EGI FJ00015]|uniref:Uncharacterized protein n=1 Tax=Lutimaribacter degradans TaxID=2945989 RepID=A0ACC5ZU43_9RHOB|nr:hypothetical protein [Lutimaribacter sp. EGI FJ00013]MCO0612733.1 hypothetical protein [Lutimaribacter sp. EGI FJ00015]MCO0635391.1 hypothetical protein [Lutimaribacter sp. EGI FJ00014]
MRGILVALFCAVTLAGCTVKPEIPRSPETIQQAQYRHDGPPALTLFTMKSNTTGAGAHTALMVNGSQRVIFDPAGSFRNEAIIRSGDVVYGVTPQLLDVYTRFHARETYHVQVQWLEVSAELAEAILRDVRAAGRQPDARCAASVSEILSRYEQLGIQSTWYPNKLARDFGEIGGVTTRELYEYDSDDNRSVLETFDPDRAAAQRVARSAE